MSPISPTLSATSTDISQPLPDLIENKGFDYLFNFDEYDASDSQSPATISMNATPSPHPYEHSNSPSTLPLTPNYAGDDFDFNFDTFGKDPIAGPSDQINIKQEPIDFDFNDNFSANIFQPPAVQVAQPLQVPLPSVPEYPQPIPNQMDFSSNLPPDQQKALQELMWNIVQYQNQFPSGLPAVSPQTIEPSVVFSTSPSAGTTLSSSASMPSSNNLSPFSTFTPPQPTPQPAQVAQPVDLDDTLVALPVDEQQPIAKGSRPRQGSTFSSIDDIDSKIERLAPLEAIFSAGRGKGGKKGGGMSSVVRMEDEEMDDDDAWRPSPEEYKKLSSKEKRQLRNKLSARAFRTRRKDYIGTLEGHIKDRDSVIDEIKTELINSRTENQDLRRELAALKASTMSILHPESAKSNPPAPTFLSALAMSPSLPVAGPSTPKRTPAPTPTFNPNKDLPSSSTEASRSQWGINGNMFGGNGPTICHHILTPDLILPSESISPVNLPRVNLNPHLNDADVRGQSLAAMGGTRELNSTFAEWSENTPFSLRSMDSYRIQLWSRLAREARAEKEKIAPELRPKFYVEAKSTSTASTSSSTAEASLTQHGADVLAKVATNHITSKLAQSFWSAFAAPGTTGKYDTDKLTAVVTGQARLKVVASEREELNEKSAPVESSTKKNAMDEADALAAAMGGLKLQTGLGMGSLSRLDTMNVRENPLGALSTFFKHASGVPARV